MSNLSKARSYCLERSVILASTQDRVEEGKVCLGYLFPTIDPLTLRVREQCTNIARHKDAYQDYKPAER